MSKRSKKRSQPKQKTISNQSSRFRWVLIGVIIFFAGVILYFSLRGLFSKNFLNPIVVIDHKDPENTDVFLPLSVLRNQLPKYLSDPQIGKRAQAVFDSLSQYEEFAKQQFSFASGMEIDCIGTCHMDMGEGDNDPVFRRSQAEQKELLEHYPYDIIGLEGWCSDHVTWNSMADEAMAEAKNMGVPVTRQGFMATTRRMIKLDGVLMYYDQHPKANLTGCEDHALLTLNLSIVVLLEHRATELEELMNSVARARSLMVLARMINQMRLQNLHTGVIVMGFAHARDFNTLFGALGTKSRIFGTI